MKGPPSLCLRCGRPSRGGACRRCGAPPDAVQFRALGPFDRKVGVGCAATAGVALAVSGGLAAVFASRPGWGLIVGALLAVAALGCLVTILVGLDMAFAQRWAYSSTDGALHGRVERFGGLVGGQGSSMTFGSAIGRAPRETSSLEAAIAGFDHVVAALEARGRRIEATNQTLPRAFVARALAALTGMSARGEVEVALGSEVVWRKPYARGSVAREPRPRVVIARTGSELPTGDFECLLNAVVTGTEAMHRIAGGAAIAGYREGPPRSEMKLSLDWVLHEIDRERLTPRAEGDEPARAERLAGAIDDYLTACPELATVLWHDLVEHARARFED